MNAGAEYVLYRIWAALQDRNGIHAESLLTCVGALAGYACQVYVRQSAALPGADPGAYALRAVEATDGATYLYGDALNVPLAEGPLSIWALVGRTVQKLGEPLPDIEDIFRHVTQTVGTSTFGVPRVPAGPRPRHAAIVYLKQVWPQILPIAQRFCNKPMQMPVLFGIAIRIRIGTGVGVAFLAVATTAGPVIGELASAPGRATFDIATAHSIAILAPSVGLTRSRVSSMAR